jgi:hypothetical protein
MPHASVPRFRPSAAIAPCFELSEVTLLVSRELTE